MSQRCDVIRRIRALKARLFPSLFLLGLLPGCLFAQSAPPAANIQGWLMQDASKVGADAAVISSARFKPQGWYAATVPGTVLTTLVNNGVYPEPLYGENMRAIPESLNKTSYWYRAAVNVPAAYKGRHTWLHFGGVNYSAQIWVNGHEAGTMRGAFIRGDFDITTWVRPGSEAVLAVLVSPQPHPGCRTSTRWLWEWERMAANPRSTGRPSYPPLAGTGWPRCGTAIREFFFRSRWTPPGR